MNRIKTPTRSELTSAIFASIVSGAVVGITLRAGGNPGQQEIISSLTTAFRNGWKLYLIGSVIFGAGFAVVATYLTDRYVAFVLSLTSQHEMIRKAVMPLTNWFGMQIVVTATMGLLYGAISGGLLSLTLVVFRINWSILNTPAHIFGLGFLLYGVSLGSLYSVFLSD